MVYFYSTNITVEFPERVVSYVIGGCEESQDRSQVADMYIPIPGMYISFLYFFFIFYFFLVN